MNKLFIVAALFVATLLCVTQADFQMASCRLQAVGSSGVYGNVTVIATPNANEFIVSYNVTGIPGGNGDRGVTVRAYPNYNGQLQPIFTTDANKIFACNYGSMVKEGSWGNIAVMDNSFHQMITFTGQFSLTGEQSIIGRVFTLHESGFNCNTGDNSTNGPIAQCVFGIANSAVALTTYPFLATYLPSPLGNNIANTVAGATGVTAGDKRASCYMEPIGSNLASGIVYYDQDSNGEIKVTSRLTGLLKSAHGLHIHTYGDINKLNAAQTGAHWNGGPISPSLNRTHNLPLNDSRELGDLGNICAFGLDDSAYYTFTTNYMSNFTNTIGAPASTFVGHATVVHLLYDNGTANSFGARIGQCVISYDDPTKGNLAVAIPMNLDMSTTPRCESGFVEESDSGSGSSLVAPIILVVLSILSIVLF